MKKILCLFGVVIFASVGVANAQIEKGNLMIGTDLGSGIASPGSNSLFGMNFNLNKNSGFSFGLSPKIGYFIKDNLLIGGIVDFGFTKAPKVNGIAPKTTVYGVQALGRYYLSPGEQGVDNLLKHGRFFAEANAGIAGVNVTGGNTTNGFAFGFGPGYSYFITPNVALEGLVKYNGLVGGGNTTYQHALGLNFGVQVFLPSSRVRSAVNDPSQL
ncbi:MAG TPA: hypothetical protein VFQ86_06595 [Arachidicoccus soli]|uniref:Outer membrane protein beta-barrel domain-containing protein n=1 Tax=Arachidicoccus soli TaxID=2341117 RepID=A0A386HS34_9BACT|nr:hypothetical protein [Arachidicoccus soli]AYD48386.1 hypothetical protein D6B99_12710 [Arachidicoccus soli]HEU0227387.1 hypothetical protein [Arachidicoccus soli]